MSILSRFPERILRFIAQKIHGSLLNKMGVYLADVETERNLLAIELQRKRDLFQKRLDNWIAEDGEEAVMQYAEARDYKEWSAEIDTTLKKLTTFDARYIRVTFDRDAMLSWNVAARAVLTDLVNMPCGDSRVAIAAMPYRAVYTRASQLLSEGE